jgi:hypothetical protein
MATSNVNLDATFPARFSGSVGKPSLLLVVSFYFIILEDDAKNTMPFVCHS